MGRKVKIFVLQRKACVEEMLVEGEGVHVQVNCENGNGIWKLDMVMKKSEEKVLHSEGYDVYD